MKMTLKAARINAGYKQAETLSVIGVSIATLSKYETGQRSPNIETALKMCKLYGVELSDIDWSVAE